MTFSSQRYILLLALLWLWAGSTSTTAGTGITVARAVSVTSRYHKAHSLGDNYEFDPRDGWQVANVTNLQYKYRRDHEVPGARRRSPESDNVPRAAKGVGGALKGILSSLKGLVGIGKPERVTITW